MKKLALITGATSGIGLATAKIFAKSKIDLILCGRREDRLRELSSELSSEVRVTTLKFDVSDNEQVQKAIESLPTSFQNIDILINSAGGAHGRDTFDTATISDIEMMIDSNIKGLVYVSKAVVPLMIKKSAGHIVNVSSVAGRDVYRNGTIYCATKASVDALTEGMRKDLFDKGIKVSQIAPGLVNTEFSLTRFKGDKVKADEVYSGITPLSAEDVADAIHFMVTRPDHINIADVFILPKAQASASMVDRK